MEERKTGAREKAGRVYTVSLEGMSFNAFHGVLPQEKAEGNSFVVDLEYDCRSLCALSDNLALTVDYSEVYGIVREIMEEPRDLLETVACTICDRVLDRFESISRVEVTIKKKNPPVAGPCEWSAVKTSSSRQ